jgi:ABC-type bacteriocin/lantibiotic exporter with double-glycine peptidase domain
MTALPSDASTAPQVDHPLLRLLLDLTCTHPPHRARSASALPDETWQVWLERVTHEADLRVSWQADSAAAIAQTAGVRRPAVTQDARGWWIAGPNGADRVTHLGADGVASSRRISDLGDGPHAWALVDPDLPASSLGGHLAPWTRVLHLLRLEAPDIRALTGFAAVAGLLSLATPLLIQVVVNTVAFGTLRQPLYVTTGLLFAGLSAVAILQIVERFLVELMQRRLILRVTADLASRLPQIRSEVHQRVAPTEIVNRFFDVLTVQKSLAGVLIDGLDAALQTVVGLTLLALYHPALLGYDVLLLGAFAVVLLLPARGATETAIKESKAKHAVAGWLEQVAANPEVFRTAAGRRLATERADALSADWLTYRSKHFGAFVRQYASAMSIQVLAATALLALGGSLVLDQQLSLGQLVAAELVVTRVLLAFGKLTDKMESTYDLVAALDKLGHVVDLPRLEPGPLDATTGPVPVVLRDLVTAGAPAAILTDVPAGDRLALVSADPGWLGAIADVITGVTAPASGSVEIDRQPLAALGFAQIRARVMLLREPDLFAGSVWENLSLRRSSITPAAAKAALDAVGFDRGHLDEGLQTELGPGGAPLNDDARVQLVIARAIVQRPSIIVVDRTLDHLRAPAARALLGALQSTGATLIVLTRHPEVVTDFSRTLALSPTGAMPSRPSRGAR